MFEIYQLYEPTMRIAFYENVYSIIEIKQNEYSILI